MKFGIRKKFLTGFLLLSLLPLIGLSFYTRASIDSVLDMLLERNRTALTENSMSLLEARAQGIAAQVEQLLVSCVDDLKMLATLPAQQSIYLDFAGVHQRDVWDKENVSHADSLHTNNSRIDKKVKESFPLYVEVTFVDMAGMEEIRIEHGRDSLPGRDVSAEFTSQFGKEDYFRQAIALEGGHIYVSHLTGYHIRKKEDLNGDQSVEKAAEGLVYKGIIRFAVKKTVNGVCQGVVSLALDHRHLMEFTQHVLPFGNREVIFPSYESGNYAFMFDDEGWMITHPKLWDIRGTDPSGKLVDPSSAIYSEEHLKSGLFPFNLLYVPFVHENYNQIAKEVIAGHSGVTQTSSVKGIKRVLAYAPVKFNHGVYKTSGCFGGVTLGAQTDEFHSSVKETSAQIDFIIKRMSGNAILLIFATGLLVTIIALFLARGFTKPIVQLTQKVNEISSGYYDVNIEINSGDELEILGKQFTEMGCRLKLHEQNLVKSLDELKQHVGLLRSIHAGMLSSLVVFDKNGKVLSVNPRAVIFFNQSQGDILGSDIDLLLSPYPELMALTRRERKDKEIHGESIEIRMPGGKQIYLETSISTIRGEWEESDQSTLLIFRDVTKRKNMEKHISRSDKLISLGILAAGIAHEIRNPLTGITLMLDDLHDRIANRTNDRLLIQRALEEIEKLENIVTRLLEFASKPAHAPVLQDINKVVADTLFFVKKQCKQKGVILKSNTTPDLPLILIDRERIRQAILNIVLNALNVLENSGQNLSDTLDVRIETGVLNRELTDDNSGSLQKKSDIGADNIKEIQKKEKAIQKGEIQISTSLMDASEGQFIVLSIKDNGPGIAKEDQEAIFDPFFSHNPDGFGLGLSITHTIVEEHGGRIIVESEQGSGACFNIHLPVA